MSQYYKCTHGRIVNLKPAHNIPSLEFRFNMNKKTIGCGDFMNVLTKNIPDIKLYTKLSNKTTIKVAYTTIMG